MNMPKLNSFYHQVKLKWYNHGGTYTNYSLTQKNTRTVILLNRITGCVSVE